MRAAIPALAAWLLACAAPLPPDPACAEPLRPLPEASCELDQDVADYKRDTVMTLWSYVGSQTRLPVVILLDGRARVETLCLEEGGSVRSAMRKQLDRAIRTLRAMPPAPACLAGTRLELGEDFADASRGWRGRERRQPSVEELCTPGQQSCAGWQEPVCALLSDGSRETYDDACQACRDPAVTGYDEGRCPRL